MTSTNTYRQATGLIGGRQYFYRVQAVNACGTVGSYTVAFSFTTPLMRPGAPADSLNADSAAGQIMGLAANAPAVLHATAYPNPATDALRLILTDELQAEQAITTVEVYDPRGARVLTAPFEAATGTLRVAALAPGLYTATVRSSAQSATVRFVKE